MSALPVRQLDSKKPLVENERKLFSEYELHVLSERLLSEAEVAAPTQNNTTNSSGFDIFYSESLFAYSLLGLLRTRFNFSFLFYFFSFLFYCLYVILYV
jgi:hypothetical protein